MHLNGREKWTVCINWEQVSLLPKKCKNPHTIPQAYSSDEYPTGNYKTQHGVDNTE